MHRCLIPMVLATALTAAACGQSPPDGQQAASDEADQRAQGQAQAQSFTVPGGTLIHLTLNDSLGSAHSRVGDGFTARVASAVIVDGRKVIPAGSTVRGTVREVRAAKRGAGNASLTLGFTRIDLPGGYSSEISASLTDRSESKKRRNAAIIGGSAAGGAVLGRVLGKDTKGAVVGSVVGGAIGTGVVLSKEGEQVDLPEGTPIAIQLDSSIKVPAK